MCPSVCLSVCTSVYLYACLSVYLYTDDEEDENSNIISTEGEEWLLANQALADHFLNESEKDDPSMVPGDR